MASTTSTPSPSVTATPEAKTSITCSNLTDDIPSPLVICGIEIPTELTTRAYTPEVIEDYDLETDSRKHKFGGSYTVQTPELKHWPVCHQCSKSLSLMFQTGKPSLHLDQVEDDNEESQDDESSASSINSDIPSIEALNLNDQHLNDVDHSDDVDQHHPDIQFLMCINTDCNADECSTCGSDGPCFKLIKCDLDDPSLISIKVPNPLPCYPILCWNVVLEPTNMNQVIKWIMDLPNIKEILETRSNDPSLAGFPDEDIVFNYVISYVNEGFKFGGCPASTQGVDTYSNYLQLAEEPFFPYMWGDCGILHVDETGTTMKGDMC
jgi:hypothetical protein